MPAFNDWVKGSCLEPIEARKASLVARNLLYGAAVLQRLHRQIRRRSKKFATGTVEYRHATRKTVKRLRYIAELSASLFQPRKVKRFLSTVAPAQERLGELNDLLVAAEIYQSLTDRHGQAWFAVGWLKARERAAVKRAIAPLQRVADAEPFWR